MKYIGAHFSVSNGFTECVEKADSFGANSFALFTKPAMQWRGKIITEDISNSFCNICKKKFFPSESILAHASYLINMGNPNKWKRQNAKEAFIEEMKRCRQLGISMLNFHPGSHLDGDINICIRDIGECIQEAIEEVPEVMPVIETMAGQGSNIGSRLEEIRDIISNTGYEDRVGVCIDTCHSFAAGYDFTTEEKYEDFMKKFDEIIGLKKLKGMHLNDSKFAVGMKKDRHEQIGKGFIGVNAFKCIIKDKRTDDIPLILETPDWEKWKDEIALLKSFI